MASLSPGIWVDGEVASALPLPDRGLDFGDGVFETLLVRRGRPVLLEYHLQRLQRGLAVLAFPDCLGLSRAHLLTACESLVAQPWSALRLTVTRGAGPRGYAPPDTVVPRIVITAAPLEQDRELPSEAITIGFSDINWSISAQLAGIKHLNRLEQVMAANEARRASLDDVVMCDGRGRVCSLSAANLFLVQNGCLLTPSLEDVGIAGTRRRLVIEELAPGLGLDVVEGVIHPEQLAAADELFCCNALRGLQPIRQLGDRLWPQSPVCSDLHQAYRGCLRC